MSSTHIVQKLWNYCNILRDDGLSYGDYVEQLTFLLFLKMADEQSRPPFNRASPIPKGFGWDVLVKLDGDDLETHYRHTLEELGKRPGLIGVIFRKAQNKIQDPAKLRRLIADLIDKEEWSSLDTDVKGDAYEGLLQKNAEDVKGGAGQYFTPRPLIKAIVDVMQPQPGEVVCDPACGTGGFLLAAHDFVRKHHKLDKAQLRFLNTEQLRGVELVDGVARLCCMNLVLHGIGSDAAQVPVQVKDALAGKHGEYEMVLTNPPFGKKSSVTIVNEAGETSKEIAHHQPRRLLGLDLEQAAQLPPARLHDPQAARPRRSRGARQRALRRRRRRNSQPRTAQAGRRPHALALADRHLLRARREGERPLLRPQTRSRQTGVDDQALDLRLADEPALHPQGKPAQARRPRRLRRLLQSTKNRTTARRLGAGKRKRSMACHDYEELTKRDKVNLDIFWLKDESLEDSANLPDPDVIAAEIVEDLEAALEQFAAIAEDLKK